MGQEVSKKLNNASRPPPNGGVANNNGATAASKERFTPLIITSVRGNNWHELRDFIRNRDVDLNELDSMHQTALHWAVRLGSVEMVRTLVEAGASLEVADADGASPLLTAVVQKKNTLLPFLLESGANVNTQSHTGLTPLHSALRYKTKPVVRSLINAGASGNTAMTSGETPLHAAVMFNDGQLVVLLIKSSPWALRAESSPGGIPLRVAAVGTQVGEIRGQTMCATVINMSVLDLLASTPL